MFGYVRPLKGELKVSQFERYKAIYCGLCRSLGKNYGFLSRFTVSYDLTFLAALLMSGDETVVRGRCPGCCVRKKPMLCGDALDMAACKNLVLTWFSLKDKQADGGLAAKLCWGTLSLLLRPAVNKAKTRDPDFYLAARDHISALTELERQGCQSIDKTAHAFASLLECAVPNDLPENVSRPMRVLMYNIGRFIYIADAVDDIEDDLRSGAFNPVVARFRLKSSVIPDDVMAQLDVLMENCVDFCSSAAVLLDNGANEPVISNIIYFGLPAVWQSIKAGTFNKRAKQENS